MLLAFPFDNSCASYSRYNGNTQRHNAHSNRLYPADAHRRRKNRTLKVAPSARNDHCRARLSQVRSIIQCCNLYRGLRRVRFELGQVRRQRPGHGYLGFCTGAEHRDI